MDALVAANDGAPAAHLERAAYRTAYGSPEDAEKDAARARELAPDDARVLLTAAVLASTGFGVFAWRLSRLDAGGPDRLIGQLRLAQWAALILAAVAAASIGLAVANERAPSGTIEITLGVAVVIVAGVLLLVEPRRALQFGLLLSLVSVPLLTFAVGPIPGALAAIALVSYVLLYTPMKRRSAAALLVGAVAGAMPPLIGWTAATGQFDLPGLLLFAVLFLWQVPHFLAITLLRGREYARAGLVVQADGPAGERQARRNIVLYTAALIAVSLMFIPLGVGGTVYLIAAVASGALFLALGIQGLRGDRSGLWARREFLGSLAYLTVLLAVLLLDRPHVF